VAVAAISVVAAIATLAVISLHMDTSIDSGSAVGLLQRCGRGFHSVEAARVVCSYHRDSGIGAINPIDGERKADDGSDGTQRPAGGERRMPGGGIGGSASHTT